ncbi:restriction endonuclease [Agromyces sp. PvR057]|uniref:restriction endonuclease n=1 Tax=Agromyces sp. PvR057 TaxID=3156403 RepID=UPI003399F1B7
MPASISFDKLASADLIVDAVYEGGRIGNASDDPIARLLPIGNSGGIRYKGPVSRPIAVGLVTSGTDPDWPDSLNPEAGTLTYFGDNKRGGRELHDTPRGGNELLRNIFGWANGSLSDRELVPPVFAFGRTGEHRDHRFLGLAVPGAYGLAPIDELVGIWRSSAGTRYQNYRAVFTILDAGVIRRSWIDSIAGGTPDYDLAPSAWLAWSSGGAPVALRAPQTTEIRSRRDQEASTPSKRDLVDAIYHHFKDRPHDFEHFAAQLIELYLPNVSALQVTRPSRDGGRDAVGKYRIGVGASSIDIDFAVEAKCYRPGSGVGVRELSRLISRLRHRQFGVIVTTSHIDRQAYSELKEDGHPIVVLAGGDIADLIHSSGVAADGGIEAYLQSFAPSYKRSSEDRS